MKCDGLFYDLLLRFAVRLVYWKIDKSHDHGGRSVGIFFFFFLRTVRELSFPIFFLKFLNGENSGGMQSKRMYKSCKCFFKPLNTTFSKFFAQIWHKKKKKKKTRPCFFAFYGRSGEGNINIFFFLPNEVLGTMEIILLHQVSSYIRVKTKKYKELGPAKWPCYKRVLFISDLFITRFHCSTIFLRQINYIR